ncbi:MAG: amino acid adenylation domain-containing protein, partial [Bacteroidota bacterium]
RKAYIVEDTKLKALLIQSENLFDVLEFQVNIFSVDIQLEELKTAEDNLELDIAQTDLAYVIYTSGSTGKPKGVMIEHGSIKNTVFAQIDGFDIKSEDHCLQFASFSFDASVSETFTALCAGASLYIVSKKVRSNPMEFVQYMNNNAIQVATIPPAYLDQIDVDQLTCLKTLVTAGESAVYEKAEGFLRHGTYLNAYGPTEASICATMFKVAKGEKLSDTTTTNVPIGQPIANAQIYLIDQNEELVPVGVVGELCIGGNGLARGYLNREALTEEKFIANKFNVEASDRIYKTGDLARWLPNGNVEFLGRIDHQVKIRGFRIELEEIEAVLQKAPAFQQCVVVAKGERVDDKRLVAYVVSEGEFDRKTIQDYLKAQLPDYMVPSQMMSLEKLPMTINGKVDKKALPEPAAADLSNVVFKAASTDAEKAVEKIWKAFLKIDEVGVNENFFDLGGHSLMAARVVAALQEQLGLQVALIDIFNYPTIAQLAVFIDQLEPTVGNMTITASERPERIPLSYAQERLWFIDQLEGSVHYHMPAVLRFKGELNASALKIAISSIVNRHEVIRTVFEEVEGKAYQKIMPINQWKLNFTPLNEFAGDRDAFIAAEIERPFDLSQDHMLRANLLQVAEEEFILVFVMHHIASDGWSMSILVDELMAGYKAAVRNVAASLPELSIQYADYALWQREVLSSEAMSEKLKYWQTTLADTEPLNLPTDYTRPAIQSSNGQTLAMNFDAELAEGLKAIAKEEGVTLFMLLLSAIKVLMYKYSGQTDICIGTPIANRPEQQTEALIGYFLNTLALRTDLSGNPAFTNLLNQVKNISLEAYNNQEVPFERIVDLVESGRDQSRSPIFQVMFVLQNTPEMAALQLSDVEVSAVEFEDTTALFDLTFNLAETETGLDLNLVYCTDLFAASTIQNMMAHFEVLLRGICANRQAEIDQLSILSSAEEAQLQSFLNAPVDYPRNKTIVNLFEDQAALRPEHVALSFEGASMTYRELNERANRFAAYLMQQGVEVEDLVSICLQPSFEMIVSILGIIKAGGAYVPIDPDYPQDRINYIIDDAQARFIVSELVHADLFIEHANAQTIFIDEQKEAIAQCPGHNPEVALTAENLIYVIYTSGSTGKPKGVLLEHRNLVRLFVNDQALYDFGERDVWTMFHSFCFDFSVWEMYGALLFGGQLIVVPKEVRKDTNAYAALLHNNGVTVLNQTPGAFNLLQESYLATFDKTNIRYVIFGGEALNPTQLQNWNKAFPNCHLINMYGITETTVHVTYKALSAADLQLSNSNIGRAIPTLDTYVLDPAGNLCPLGVSGELYVAGDGLARGYLNRPELTTERFIEQANGQRWYRTGDLAKWSSEGELEYLGRIDHQVKIRGFRIELGEIEAVLLQSTAVNQGVVLARVDTNGNKRLVAYVVPEGTFDRASILNDLGTQLPDYMVPAIIVELDSMPLTVNGKINKKALPEPDVAGTLTTDFIAPRSEFETSMANIWSDLLNVEKVGVHDNFFELGGDSIITIQVISRAKRAGIQLKPRDLFQYQTIAELNQLVEQNNWTVQAEQGQLTGEAALLPIQKWFFDNETALHHYNQAELLELDKNIDASTLATVSNALLAQHDALRFNYQNTTNWTQYYGSTKEVFETIDLSKVTKAKWEETVSKLCREYQQSLNIEKGELMKVVLIKTPKREERNRLFIVIHHLAVDGVSWRILIEQMELALAAVQNGDPIDFGSKSSSYREWADALTTYAQTPTVLNQLPYWEEVAENYQPLPIDLEEANTLAKDVQTVAINLSEELTQALLQQVNQAYHTEINDILLAALAKTLNGWAGRKNLVIGLEGHGREDLFKALDLSSTVGWFTNLYPVALETTSSMDASSLIKNVKEQLRTVPGKGMGYGLLKYLNQDEAVRARLSNTQWDVVFNYLGQIDNLVNENSSFQAAQEDAGNPLADEYAFDARMDISGLIANGRLNLNWVFSNQQYEVETINQLAVAYLQNLTELIEHCVAKEDAERTASDYGLAPMVDTQSLDAFLNMDWNGQTLKDQIRSVYPLSPVQEGMLFHGLYDQASNAYVVQHQFHLPEGLDLNAFKTAFEWVLNQHSILRTGFFHEQLSIPVQCVFNHVELPFEVQDYTMLSGAALTREIGLFMEADRRKGFDFTAAPLMRLTFIKVDDEAYKMIWTCHHILFDGWSMPIIMQELLTAYEALVQGNALEAQTEDLFEDYVRYINSKEEAEEKAFWTDYLRTFESPSLIPFVSKTLDRNKGKGQLSIETLLLDETYTEKIRQFAQENHITVNTLVQGVWSLLLSKYTGGDAATFGVTVSGRPGDLSKAEQRVGVFINTLPLHVSAQASDEVLPWLAQIQNGHTAAREYQYTAQSDI